MLDLVKQKLSKQEWLLNEVTPVFISELQKHQPFDVSMPPFLRTSLHYKLLSKEQLNLNANYNYCHYNEDFLSIFTKLVSLPAVNLSESQTLVLNEIFINIEEQDAQLYEWHTNFGRAFVVINDGNFRAASHPQVFGLIMLTPLFFKLSRTEQVLSIVHESAHQELFLLNLLDRLVLPEADLSMSYAPLQRKNRPPIGRLHATHALFRMCLQQYRQTVQSQELIKLFKQSLLSLRTEELTSFGNYLKESIYEKTLSHLIVDLPRRTIE